MAKNELWGIIEIPNSKTSFFSKVLKSWNKYPIVKSESLRQIHYNIKCRFFLMITSNHVN
jgi:hypothetical protein